MVASRFFDEVEQDGICSVGALLKINDEHIFSHQLNCGHGTNTKAELLTLLCLVKFVIVLGIDTLHIFGVLLVIVNWKKKIWPLQVISLEQWCYNLVINHIYREHNKAADSLSKEALSTVVSILLCKESIEGTQVEKG